jgi:hypothetical protein
VKTLQQRVVAQAGEPLGEVDVEPHIETRFHCLFRSPFRVAHEHHCARRRDPALPMALQDGAGGVFVLSQIVCVDDEQYASLTEPTEAQG